MTSHKVKRHLFGREDEDQDDLNRSHRVSTHSTSVRACKARSARPVEWVPDL